MFRPKLLLPAIPIYIMMGGVGENFGGVTTVALHRSSVFAEMGDRQIGFLTTSTMHAVDPAQRERELRKEGRLGEKVHFRNAWHDLGVMPDDDLRALGSDIDEPAPHVDDLLPYEGQPQVTRVDAEGTVLQIDFFRQDGTRFASDRKDVREPGSLGGRVITAFTRDGQIANQWGGARFVYHAWLDWLTQGKSAIIIVDSANSADLMLEYRRDNVLTVHPIHSNHVYGRTHTGRARLAPNQRKRFTLLDRFDIVTTLTERQAKDLRRDGIAGDNVVAIPNMTAAPVTESTKDHRHGHGVVLSRLSADKRIEHMISAIAAATSQPSLDIYGHGVSEAELLEQVRSSGLAERVRLCGYSPSARERFAESSFTLLTSPREGQSLVLIEAMAAGSIPIAYDIDYGPSDIVEHGVNGFLVPAGDTGAMARAIDDLSAMSEKECAAMRRAAKKTARDYRPERIVRRWSGVLRRGLKHKHHAELPAEKAMLTDFSVADGRLEVTVTLSDAVQSVDAVRLTWLQRNGVGYGRVPAEATNGPKGLRASAVLDLADITSFGPGTYDLWIDASVRGNVERLRIKGAGKDLPVRSGRVEVYATKYSSLSLTVDEAAD